MCFGNGKEDPAPPARPRHRSNARAPREPPTRSTTAPQLPGIKITTPSNIDLSDPGTSKTRTGKMTDPSNTSKPKTRKLTYEEEDKEIADYMRKKKMDRIQKNARERLQNPKADIPVQSASRESREQPAQLPARPVTVPRLPSVTVTAPVNTDLLDTSYTRTKPMTRYEEDDKEIADQRRREMMIRLQTPRERFRPHQPSAQAARTPSEEALRKVLF